MQKTWAERLNEQPELVSDADEQLLIYIPFVPLPKAFASTRLPFHPYILYINYSVLTGWK